MRPLYLAAALSLAFVAPAFAADPVEGDWLTQDGAAKVHVAPCAGAPAKLCGKITWLKEPNENGQPKRDAHNPDAALRSRPIVGLPFLRDFSQVGPGKWKGGKIYDPQSGKTYDSKMQVNANGTLKLDGCVLMFCQSQTWKRS